MKALAVEVQQTAMNPAADESFIVLVARFVDMLTIQTVCVCNVSICVITGRKMNGVCDEERGSDERAQRYLQYGGLVENMK